jgi:cold shock CspA family protein
LENGWGDWKGVTKDKDPWSGCRSWGGVTPASDVPVKEHPSVVTAKSEDVASVSSAASTLQQSSASGQEVTTRSEGVGRHSGKIRSFNPEKGFGFVVCSEVDRDVFLNANCIIGDAPPKCVGYPGHEPSGPQVTFDLETRGGRPRAVNARLVSSDVGSEVGSISQQNVAVQHFYIGGDGDNQVNNSAHDSNMTAKTIGHKSGPVEPVDNWHANDVLKMLPADAPAGVRAYLEALAQAQGGANGGA